ncbi:MAG: methionyl-tRNA formyltransferase [Lachnospiraceae bacterium]
MRVIFMGTPDFAVSALEAILQNGHEVLLVVTKPDKPKGRGKAMQSPAVKECAVSHGLKVFQPVRIREPEPTEYLRSFGADIFIVAAFGQILSKEILQMPNYGCINIHASLLPKYRGAAPIQWAIINGDPVTGVTTMRMDVGVDTGDMILKKEVEIAPDETGGSLFAKLQESGAQLIVETMAALKDHTAVYEEQVESEATHVGMIQKQMGKIDWQKKAIEIERLIRGLDPWPSAYTAFEGKVLKLWKAKVNPYSEPGAIPGQVIETDKEYIRVQTGEGSLDIFELQLEGKKRLDTETFLLGHKIKKGIVFGDS